MRKIPAPVIVYVLLVLYTASPIICVLIASGIAGHYNCVLDESGAHPCMVGGRDIGGTLVTLFVTGWLMLLTLPTGGTALLIYTIGLISAKSYAKRNKPTE